jgi:hypothetical protein
MKKAIIVISIFLLFYVHASGSRESWISGGEEFCYSMESETVEDAKIYTTINSVGAHLNVLQFANDKNVGVMVHDSFLLPLGGVIRDGESFYFSFADTEFKTNLGLMVGPVLRKSLDDEKDLYMGAGISIQMLELATLEGDGVMSLLFGAGVDCGLRIDIGERTYWDVGLLYPYSGKLFDISLRPHLGIGYRVKMKYL